MEKIDKHSVVIYNENQILFMIIQQKYYNLNMKIKNNSYCFRDFEVINIKLDDLLESNLVLSMIKEDIYKALDKIQKIKLLQ